MISSCPTVGSREFHPLVRQWFEQRFGNATEAQLRGWPEIASGRDVLIAAPTGSGKTLAAFLWCLDRLFRACEAGELGGRTEVIYISPLKALGSDIAKNLRQPLAEISALFEARGSPRPDIRVFVRSGDTPSRDRTRMLKIPPHILITTPESLFILLTADKSRRLLRHVKTVIVDEIHAVADSKRGSHLALSLERLDELAQGAKPARLGLSATQRPIEVVGRLLVGNGRPLPKIIDTGWARALDLAIETPEDALGAVTSTEMWTQVCDRIAGWVQEHTTTLIFANTRRLVERLSHQLAERLGPEKVAAHHGSLAHKSRLRAEQGLKQAEIPCVVATASLELGIDVGSVDLVVQIGSPRRIATLLQRVGRSGHSIGKTPKGRLLAMTRDQLVECTSLLQAVQQGRLDCLWQPRQPMDVLAQQIVAACAAEDQVEDELFAWVRRAAPYGALERSQFDELLRVLSEPTLTARGRSRVHLHRDGVRGRVMATRGARLAAITSGGSIPDKGDYRVIAQPEGLFIGTVDEDFAVESMVGDIFQLGNTSWRVRKVSVGTIDVADAEGAPPTIPFWRGEAPARSVELSAEVAGLRSQVERGLLAAEAQGLPPEAAVALVARSEVPPGLVPDDALQLVRYLAASRAILGCLPTTRTLIAERFFDDAGGMQLVIHAPLGGRINKAWGLALRKRFCRSFNFELQATATDDGLLLSLGAQHSFPLESVFGFLSAQTVRKVLEQAVLGAPVFGTRWRWTATRALMLLRRRNGKKVPPQLLRMKSDDLLAAVFPQAQACHETIVGDIEIPEHPLVQETMRDCVEDFMDVDALEELLRQMAAGDLQLLAVDSVEPSPLCHELLNANPYAYLDDAPLEERRSRQVQTRRGLDLHPAAVIDGQAISQVETELRRVPRNAEELHLLLLNRVLLPTDDSPSVAAWFAQLLQQGRALVARYRFDGLPRSAWLARERAPLVQAALEDVRFEPPVELGPLPERDEACQKLLFSLLEVLGPRSIDALASTLGLSADWVRRGLLGLESQGTVLRGDYRGRGEEWVDRRNLARIHRLTLRGLREQVRPVSPLQFCAFLSHWQHAAPGKRLRAAEGLAEIIEQLQGLEVDVRSWESDVFGARCEGYRPEWLDALCYSGEILWGRKSVRDGVSQRRPLKVAFFFRDELGQLLEPAPEQAPVLSAAALAVQSFLADNGPSFQSAIVSGCGRLAGEVEDALFELAWAGLVSADGFAALRRLLGSSRLQRKLRARPVPGRGLRRPSLRGGRLPTGGRWSLLRQGIAIEPSADACARQLLIRYGVVFRDVLSVETGLPRWRDLRYALQRLESSGQIRGGRFVTGFAGEQFALPEAAAALRAWRRGAAQRQPIPELSPRDPLRLVQKHLLAAGLAPEKAAGG